MHCVVETPSFLRRAVECGVSDEDRARIVATIAAYPRSGDVIPGTGGARKVRISRPGRGKSGGYRVITFFGGGNIPVFLRSMFAKNEKSNLSGAEKSELKGILRAIAESYREARG